MLSPRDGCEALGLRVHGRVQGVSFRAAMQRQALALGLSGWVRNRSDGSVEALVAGPAAAVGRLRLWAAQGPPAARVERVDCSPARFPDTEGFEVLPTL